MASTSSSVAHRTYLERLPNFSNAAARSLLETIVRKRSNLCVSVDVTTKRDLLDVVEAVGGICCAVKTHIDIVEDFDQDLVDQLTALSQRLDFLIFEDRKFADIGNTVTLQYSSGVHKISSWSHITNAHLVPGPGIIAGLRKAGEPLGRGLLLLAEMSSKGNLAQGDYTRACVGEARADDFVIGFIAMHRVDEDEVERASGAPFKDFLILTPGVGLVAKGDALGQQYRTPDEVIRQSGCDVIIVGRGIYGALLQPEAKTGAEGRQQAFATVKSEAERYKDEGWKAYERRVAEARGDAALDDERKRLNGVADENEMPGLYREDGSFDIFGYGSLIFKPPPNTIKRTVGFIKGFARRFAQSSIDHRGTPVSPGRVVTLVSAEDWQAGGGSIGEEGDIVWGVSWTIDPAHAGETRRYLDWREKNGYTPTLADIWGHDESGAEVILTRSALVYVGLPTNPAYIGPEPLPKLAATIATARGPSGPNFEYVYKLAEATRALAPEVQDSHLFELEKAVRHERQRLGLETGEERAKEAGVQEAVRANVVAQADAFRSE